MITIRVPGTTANLGPGFDCFGCALSIYGEFSFEERESGLEFENVAPQYCNYENLAVQGYMRAIREMGLSEPGLYVKIVSDIPDSRGLGSSASLIVAGVVAANEIHGRVLSEQVLLNLVTELEGHPDNVAPALLGGLTASLMADGHVVSLNCPIAPKLRLCALIPDFELSTSLARSVLPDSVPRADALFNISRAIVLLKALDVADFDAIGFAMDDKLHQPYRAHLIDEYEEVRALALENGAAAFCIRGAGPTLLCVCRDATFAPKMTEAVKGLRNNWRVLPLMVDMSGAVVVGKE